MHKVYEDLLRDHLAIPVIPGEKTERERFPGAVQTFTVEAMVQDKKAIQAGTSHYLGQNFAKAANIQFLGRDNTRQLAHTTSWGVSTRLIGTLIMAHGDDDGVIIPPRVAPNQIVILPVTPKPETRQEVKRSVLLPPAEPASSEVVSRLLTSEPLVHENLSERQSEG